MKQLLLVLLFCLHCTNIYSQQHVFTQLEIVDAIRNRVNNSHENYVRWLSSKDLDGATLISFRFNNGTVAPEYQWDCEIKVTPQSINVTIEGRCPNIVLFEESQRITTAQFETLKTDLIDAPIGKRDFIEDFPCGGSFEVFCVSKGKKTVFYAETGTLEFGNNGNSSVALSMFSKIMSSKMKRAINDPESFL